MAGKVKTCTRCKGQGWGNWRVQMGRCFQCDGCGKVRTFTMAERVDLFIYRCEKHLQELIETAENQKIADAARNERRNERRAKRGQPPIDLEDSRELQQLRETYRTVSRMLAEAKRTGKVTPQQQAASEPAYLEAQRKKGS